MGTPGALRALARANVRYWPTVAPRVRTELTRWRPRAQAISDHEARALALGKLEHERFNPRLAATLATLAPSDTHGHVVEAIVALQLAYDYLDALTEQPTDDPDPIAAGERAYRPFLAPFAAADPPPGGEHKHELPGEEYVRELTSVVAGTLARLPSWSACAPAAQRAAARCARAQAIGHAAPRIGLEPARRWGEDWSARWQARRGASPTGAGALGWREALAAGQSSVLSLHALIATAAQAGVDAAQADALDHAYVYVGAMTMLDGLIDREHDLRTGAISYPALYASAEEMAAALAALAHAGLRHMEGLRDGAHHAVTLTGVVAGYAAYPRAREQPARDVFAALEGELRAELGLLLPATSLLMRGWRKAIGASAQGAPNVGAWC